MATREDAQGAASEDRSGAHERLAAADSGSCPTPDQIAELIQGNGAPAVTAALELHLDACARCRELISALCRADSTMNADAASSIQVTRVRGSPDAEAAELAPGSSIGRYTVLGPLGAGGMGVVYAAYDPELDRKVALKIVHTDIADADHRERVQDRLLYEARAMAQLSHPNVVAVHDLGRIGDRVFVAMELVEGQTLKRWLAQERRGWREIVAALVAAGQGLAAAHAAGLVHRDFKPANVLVGRDGRVRVTDFGLAQAGVPASDAAATANLAAGRSSDARSGLAGTPYYMAPEQFRREPADARTDQFSFCVALYHALYQQHPFPGATIAELSEAVTAGCLRPAPTAPRVPRWVARAILRGLCSEPAHRHRSMEDLLRALQRDPHRRLRRGVAAALAAAIGVALLVVPRTTVSRPSCAVSGDGVQQAPRAAHELPDVSSCADPRTLLGQRRLDQPGAVRQCERPVRRRTRLPAASSAPVLRRAHISTARSATSTWRRDSPGRRSRRSSVPSRSWLAMTRVCSRSGPMSPSASRVCSPR